MLAKAPGVAADMAFVDLEDSVAPSEKATARQFAVDALRSVPGRFVLASGNIGQQPNLLLLNDGTGPVGYVNLRTFIVEDASNQLRTAFQQFRAAGVTKVILDFRYNGGGLVSVAKLLGDLMAADKVGQVFARTTLRASKSAENSTDVFAAQPQAIAAMKIAVIGRSATASASELVANAFIPYLGSNIALIGANTYGKPVGQFAFDRSACDDRLRAVAFRTVNRDGGGDYYTGLAAVMPRTCVAEDGLFKPLGDPAEASTKVALDFLAGRTCAPISTSGITAQGGVERWQLLQPRTPTAAQRDNPALF